ncbi:Fructose-bisphosphate aldolase 1 [Lecanora helva]
MITARPMPSWKTALCFSCWRRAIGDDIPQSQFPFQRQLRGKKKSAKRPTTIKVRLLQDITGYGRKGSITPVEPGRMRNTWYPRQKAEYVTAASLEGVKPQDLVAERDFTFGVKKKDVEAPKIVEKEKPVEVQTKLLSPQRAFEILEASLPNHLIFYRTPIPEQETPRPEPPSRPRRATSAAAADLDAASDPLPKPPKPQLATIFGSVSTADIAEAIKAVLAGTKEGKRIVVGAEDVMILQQVDDEGEVQERGVEGDRLKALGDFKVEIRVKGAEAVMRTVHVQAQESTPEQ